MAQQWHVLLPEKMDKTGPNSISDFAEVTWLSEYDDYDALYADVDKYDAMIVRAASLEVTESLLDRAENLKIISKHGVGVDNIDIPAASERSIIVCNTPGANAQAVAEHTLGLVLAVRKSIRQADADLRNGVWERDKYATPELRESTLGVFGCGNIGANTTRFAAEIGMECLAYDPYLREDDVPVHVETVESKDVLFRESDIVCVHAPLTPETRAAIGAAELTLLGSDGIIVNTSRGGVVDEDALEAALAAGDLSGAGIDVFEDEPPAPDSPLLSRDDVILTPHIAGTTTTSARKKSLWAAENIRAVYNGNIPESTLNLQDMFDVRATW